MRGTARDGGTITREGSDRDALVEQLTSNGYGITLIEWRTVGEWSVTEDSPLSFEGER